MKKILSTLTAAAMLASSFAAFAANDDAALSQAASDKVIAFSGAEGGGMYSRGARAAAKQEVYHVTNLNDSGAGSFRDAVSKSGRFVVFDVSGMIDLRSNVVIKSNTTVLGQTAPGDGICIRGNNVKISGSDIIVRYIRFRVGAKLADGSDTRTQDGLEVTDNSERVIIDHCSVSWGTDENLSAYAVKDVTIQNCIIAEALNQSIHDKGEHSYAAIWGGVNLTVHHNIIASHKSRNPKIGTSETVAMTAGYTDDQTVVDIRNNIIYNWGDKAGYGAENGANVNIINNYYKPGPATPSNKRARIFEFSPGNKYRKGWSGAVYADGNYVDDDGAQAALVNADNWQVANGCGVYTGAGVESYVKLDAPNTTYINDYPITVTSAQDAYEYVLANAGARLPKLDAEDERILADVTNGTAPAGSKGSTGLVDDPVDTVPSDAAAGTYDDRGYPVWTSETRAADYDTDRDGIPDAWETNAGLDPSNKNDALNIGSEGRTWLELYADGTEIAGELKAEPQSAGVNDVITFTRLSGDANTLYIDGAAYSELGGSELKTKLPAGVHSAYLYSTEQGISNAVFVYVANGESYLGSGQSTSRTMDGDYKIVSRIEPSNLTNEIPSYIYAGDYIVGCGYDDNFDKKIYFGLKDAPDTSDLDADEYTIFKIENVSGTVSLYAGKSLAEWTKLESHPAEDNSVNVGTAVTASEKPTVTHFSDTYYITNESQPKIAITSIADGDRIGFNENVTVKVTPDGAKVSQLVAYYNGEIISSVPVDVESEQEVSIPVSFDGISSGELKIQCIDANLCMADASVGVYVSADLTPWQIADIGDVNSKTFVSVTDDYTYKINAPQGYIGGIADSFGYVYQRFNGDARIYYRSRMQGASQFGIMLRSSLDADATMYYFGGEYNAVGTGKLTYDLKHRVTALPSGGGFSYANGVVTYGFAQDGMVAAAAAYDSEGRMTEVRTAQFKDGKANVGTVSGENTRLMLLKSLESLEPVPMVSYDYSITNGEARIDYTLDNQQPNLYFIAEKAGNKLNIYKTENGATVFTTKELLTSIDCSALGDSYYMGFAAVSGSDTSNPPDAGWVSIDNSSGDNYYNWSFDNGLDWLWQMQESNVLKPSWTNEMISGNDSGKMVLTADDSYTSNRYVFREYQSDDDLVPAMSTSLMLTGENPAMNIYFQTGESAKAYKVSIADGVMTANGKEIGAVNGSAWYTLNIRTDATPEGTKGYLTLTNADGSGTDEVEIGQVTGTEFRTQINSKKNTVTKAVYFEPVSGSEGTCYIDSAAVSAAEPSVKFHKVESWYTFADYAGGAATIAGTTAANGSEASGESAAVGGGSLKTGTKKVDGINFTNALRIKGTAQTVSVPVKAGSAVSVYAGSASSSATRPLYINGEQHDLLGAVKTDYTASEDGTVQIYAGDNIDVWGISVVSTVIDE